MTIERHLGPIAGKRLAWIGDGNNVCASLIHVSGRLGFELNIATPPDYHPDLMDLARAGGGLVRVGHDAKEAVSGADAVFTDTWVSMGDTDHDAAEAFAAIPGGQVIHLFHNKHELTFLWGAC